MHLVEGGSHAAQRLAASLWRKWVDRGNVKAEGRRALPVPRTEPGCSFIVVPKERTRRFRMCEESVRDDLQTSDLVEPGGEIESTDRVEVKQGDARKLPFADQTFDVVVSNFVVHEMKTKADRETMMHEIARVLKPGGASRPSRLHLYG